MNIVDEISKRRGVDVLGLTLREARREFEIHYFSRLLAIHEGNVKTVAEIAGMSSEGTIYRKLTSLGLPPDVRRRE